MFRTAAIALLLTITFSSGSAFAAESVTVETTMSVAEATAYDSANSSWSVPPGQLEKVRDQVGRPAALPMLYASFAALQAYDFYSTRQALAKGGHEANPAMRGIVGNTVAFAAIKAATTIAPMLIAQRMWKTNRVGAIVTMVVANGAMAYVAANNARVLHQLR